MMIAILGAPLAQANPVALRGPHPEPTAVVGLHELSIGSPLPNSALEVGVHLGTRRGAVGVAAGRRWRLAEGEGAWAADAGVSAGLLVPLVEPSVGLTVTPWISAGPTGRRGFLQGVLALPVATSVRGGLRAPLWFELQGGVSLGPVSVGPRVGFAPVWAPGSDVSVATEGAVLLSFDPTRAR